MFSSVAAAKCPMILAETGEKREDFEAFEAEAFVRSLLSKQIPSCLSLLCFGFSLMSMDTHDWSTFVQKIHGISPMNIL